jgi:hypothetical protein
MRILRSAQFLRSATRGSLEAVYREVRKRQREYRDKDVG